MSEVLRRLGEVLEQRKGADPQTSYVAQLYSRGRTAILQKIGEEATETILAATGDDDRAVVNETADLWFHSLVMLAERGLTADDVLGELERRFGLSGVQEKAARTRTETNTSETPR